MQRIHWIFAMLILLVALIGANMYQVSIPCTTFTCLNFNSTETDEEIGVMNTKEALLQYKPPVNAFKILWGINTQIASLADPTSENKEEIAELASLVDGYSLAGNPKSYQPGLPYRCVLNKKTNDSDPNDPKYIIIDGIKYSFLDLWNKCGQLRNEYARDTDTLAEYRDAVERVIKNLNLSREQKSGKLINAHILVSDNLFSYDSKTDSIEINPLPDNVAILKSNDIIPDTLFIYQEASVGDKMLQVPEKPGGTIGYLPDNIRMVDMIGAAFKVTKAPINQFLLNIRRWKAHFPNLMSKVTISPYFGGFTLEGGTKVLWGGANTDVDNHVEAIVWTLQNTGKNLYFLMPAHWKCDGETCAETSTEESRAVLIDRLITLIKMFDEKIQEKTGGMYGMCTERIRLIVGGYGNPIHPMTLPVRTKSGKLAGTVGGEIVALDNLRKEMCK